MTQSPEVHHPKLATPQYVQKHLLGVGKTKFWAMVRVGTIRMVDVGVGRRLVDVSSVDALIAPEQKAAA